MAATTAQRRQRGFTLIELMIAVAVIAILAIVVVPSFMRESSKTKAQSEVNAVFSEIAVKEEQYKSEFNVYLSAALCPSAPSTTGVPFAATCLTAGSGWLNMRVAPPDANVSCTYQVTAGLSATAPSPPTGFTMTAPATSWWYAVATCDQDRSGGTNTTYFISSVNSEIQKQNEGK